MQCYLNWLKANRIWLFVVFVIYVSAAFFSQGSLHQDEHFQILEFMSFKLGQTTPGELPWEFESQIRPFMQPAFYFVITKFLNFIHITSPFTIAFALRAVSAIFGIVFLSLFIEQSQRTLQSQCARSLAKWGSTLFYLFPSYLVRTSSEHFSGVFFWIGLYLLMRFFANNKVIGWRHFKSPLILIAGVLWGFSFQFRFQSAFFLVGFTVWCLLIDRSKFLSHLGLGIGFISTLLLAAYVDRWGYGQWAFPPWNYFRVNLFEGVAASFGVMPWYGYITLMWTKILTPINFLSIASLWGFWVLKFRSPLALPAIFFFVGHSLVGHKELRFLIPLFYVIPFYFAYLVDYFRNVKLSPKWSKTLLYLLGIVAAINIFFMIKKVIAPANVRLPTLEYLYENNHNKVPTYWQNENPNLFDPLPMNFYIHGGKMLPYGKGKIALSQPFYMYIKRTPSNTVSEPPTSCRLVHSYPLKVALPDFIAQQPRVQKLMAKFHSRELYLCK